MKHEFQSSGEPTLLESLEALFSSAMEERVEKIHRNVRPLPSKEPPKAKLTLAFYNPEN